MVKPHNEKNWSINKDQIILKGYYRPHGGWPPLIYDT